MINNQKIEPHETGLIFALVLENIMTIDEYLKITQIAFYITAGLVAVLTYIKAKNGLLNAVNTEYQKRVMDRLSEISKDLLSEIDPESPNHWSRVRSVEQVLSRLHEKILPHKDEIIKTGKLSSGIPVSDKELELYRQAGIIRSDPFIPRSIRKKLVDFFENRARVMTEVYINELRKYQKDLSKGKHWDTLDTNDGWMHNEILSELRKRGCGIEQIEQEIHELRNSIQKYFDQFDPIRKEKG